MRRKGFHLLLVVSMLVDFASGICGAAVADGATPAMQPGEKLYRRGLALFGDLKDEDALKRGLKFFREAAKSGNADALNALGVATTFGFGGNEMQRSVGAKMLRQAAKAGSVKALYNLASLVYFGIGIKTDADLAIRYMQKAAETGDTPAAYELGKMLFNLHRFNRAQNWFARAAREGNQSAAALVGALNLFGKVNKADPERGLLSLRQLSRAGNCAAKYFLAEHFAAVNPKDTNHLDPARALDYCIQSDRCGSRGVRRAAWKVARGVAYEVGKGKYGDRLRGKAIALLKKKQADSCLARYLLGELYLAGNGRHGEYAKAKEVLQEGARKGCPECAIRLGDMYVTGVGVTTNSLRAEDYYRSALLSDKTGTAAFKVAGMVLNASHRGESIQNAYRMALQSARQGNAQACDLLATMLMAVGTGESSELKEKAYAWAIIASEHNLPHVKTPLWTIEKQLSDSQKAEGKRISQAFKMRIRRRALQEGEKSFRF